MSRLTKVWFLALLILAGSVTMGHAETSAGNPAPSVHSGRGTAPMIQEVNSHSYKDYVGPRHRHRGGHGGRGGYNRPGRGHRDGQHYQGHRHGRHNHGRHNHGRHNHGRHNYGRHNHGWYYHGPHPGHRRQHHHGVGYQPPGYFCQWEMQWNGFMNLWVYQCYPY